MQKYLVIALNLATISQKAQVDILQGKGWKSLRLYTFEGTFEKRTFF